LVQTLRELLRPHPRGSAEPGAGGVVEGDEDLAAIAVEDGQTLAGGARGGDPGAERVEGADAASRQPEAHGQAFGGGDPDPQAGERAGPEPDREQIDARPAAGGLGAALDLGEQPGRVARPATLVAPEVGLGQDLAVAPGAGGGGGGRGVEADDDQRGSPSLVPTSRERRRSRLSCP